MFKRMPVGEIYVGADVTNKMELGIITRSFSRAVLKFINTMVNDLHYSFGDSPGTSGFEKPHIVAPLFTTVRRLCERNFFNVMRLCVEGQNCRNSSWTRTSSNGKAFS